MIRRQTTDRAGKDAWVLIPQIEHAHLAAALAKPWGASPFEPLKSKELLEAIHHHDDGWATWDGSPEVDGEGRPVDFTEMRLGDALAIWRQSISAAEQIGPLAAYAVSGHFCALLDASDTRRRDAESARLAEEFFEEQRRVQEGSLDCSDACAQQAVKYLRFFDLLSLWLSCAQRNDPWEADPPEGPGLRFVPKGNDGIEVSPWPWRVEQLTVTVTGREVLAQPYESARALAEAASEEVTLEWLLSHGRPKHSG